MAWVARPAWRVAYLLLTALVLALVWCSPIHGPALSWALAPIALAWLLMPLRLRAYSRNPEAGRIATPVMALAGQLMIASTLISIATLHALPNGPPKLLFVLFLVFAADPGAYFAGRSFGPPNTAPKLIPEERRAGTNGS